LYRKANACGAINSQRRAIDLQLKECRPEKKNNVTNLI